MLDALIAGHIYGRPAERTAKNGGRFVTAKIRVPTRDGAARLGVVVAGSEVLTNTNTTIGNSTPSDDLPDSFYRFITTNHKEINPCH